MSGRLSDWTDIAKGAFSQCLEIPFKKANMNYDTCLNVGDDAIVRARVNGSLPFSPFGVVEVSGGIQGLNLAQEPEPDPWGMP